MTKLQTFKAADLSVSYTSDVLTFETRGNRTGVFQINCSATDSAVLQSRISPNFSWVDILTVTGTDVQQEIILAPQFRLVTTNATASPIKGAIHI